VIDGIVRPVAIAIKAWSNMGGKLFWKYAALVVGVLTVALAANGFVWIWFTYQDHQASLVRIQRGQAEAAAAKIGQFVREIEGHLGWMMQMPWSAVAPEARRFDALRLLRLVPAVTELAMLDETGRERLRVSRLELDIVGSGIDRSNEPLFVEAKAHRIFYGPVYLHRESEPYMTLALAGPRGDAGVSVAKVNLRFIWDVVSQIGVGQKGRAYVVDTSGRLIAHPDISLVLRNTDLSGLAHIRAIQSGAAAGVENTVATDELGRSVLVAHAAIAPLGWLVFVELPVAEAFAPLYASLLATGLVLLGGLTLAVLASLFLARKMVTPIQALQTGAAQIGAGALGHRIDIDTGDELEALGDQFNNMAAQLQGSYATLERKVEERTRQLEQANLAKSRFLAAASHDLRQPLHALGLFVAQLRALRDHTEHGPIVARIDAAVAAMNELFGALLDISKLDAGVLTPDVTEFPVQRLLRRLETTFAGAAREKGLQLRVIASDAWVRSDPILLERILLNLVSNAVHYTVRGRVLVGCRRRGEHLSLEVWDTGIGIPEDQQRNVFGEFYRLGGLGGDRSSGLGLGLAIVDRLCNLLDHPIELVSHIGKGSRFAVSVPLTPQLEETTTPIALADSIDPVRGKLVFIIDDDPLALQGMRGVLQTWGCKVVTAASGRAAVAQLANSTQLPDLIISDYHLPDGDTGFNVISRLRAALGAKVPAFLITGDTTPECLHEAGARGLYLLHKPVPPMNLRAVISQLLKGNPADDSCVSSELSDV
jgi:signal transduction histidine kinase/CheY-like chemotaxis protein